MFSGTGTTLGSGSHSGRSVLGLRGSTNEGLAACDTLSLLVSNDNPLSEAQFRKLKYMPE